MKDLYEKGRIIHEEHHDRYQFLEFYLRGIMIHNDLITYDKTLLINFYKQIAKTSNQEIKRHKLMPLIKKKLKSIYPRSYKRTQEELFGEIKETKTQQVVD